MLPQIVDIIQQAPTRQIELRNHHFVLLKVFAPDGIIFTPINKMNIMKKLTPFLIAILICVSGTIRAEQPNAANKSEQSNNTEGLFNPGMDETTTMSVTDPNATEIKADQKDSTQLTKDGGDPVVIYVSSGVVLVLIIILLIILL
jgi:hypothetical protein